MVRWTPTLRYYRGSNSLSAVLIHTHNARAHSNTVSTKILVQKMFSSYDCVNRPDVWWHVLCVMGGMKVGKHGA